MSSNTRQAEPVPPAQARDRLVLRLRIALAAAYLLLAHLASTGGDPLMAAAALFDVALLVSLRPLLQGRATAVAALAACAAGAWWLAASGHAGTVLRLVPVACVAVVGLGFARTLRRGSVPLVARIVAALDGSDPDALAPELRSYARRLTLAWALLLGALAVFDLAMALFASGEQWSWLANIGDYVVIGGFMALEFAWRRHRFPGRHRSFFGFLRQMVALGPAFWRGVATP
jgi:uncharacterized membrane protein